MFFSLIQILTSCCAAIWQRHVNCFRIATEFIQLIDLLRFCHMCHTFLLAAPCCNFQPFSICLISIIEETFKIVLAQFCCMWLIFGDLLLYRLKPLNACEKEFFCFPDTYMVHLSNLPLFTVQYGKNT